MFNYLKSIIKKLISDDKYLSLRFFWRKINGQLDDEMFYVRHFLKKKRRFIDIGANVGIYSYYFSQEFKWVEAFEPVIEITEGLSALKCKGVSLYHVALSDKSGRSALCIPFQSRQDPMYSRSYLSDRNKINDVNLDYREVEVNCLDTYAFEEVDLIKIDVEGHEESVLRGAQNTIKKYQPILLIEIEQRHLLNQIESTIKEVLDLGYEGFFLSQGVLKSITEFSDEVHQKPYLNELKHKDYINNFIFKPIK